jgi:hypothetical protein
MSSGAMISDPGAIRKFHMLAQEKALKLEGLGIKFRGGSVLAHVKRTYGLKGNRQAVAIQLARLINEER